MRIDPIEMTIQSKRGSKKRSFLIGSVAGVRYACRDIQAMRKKLDDMSVRDGHLTAATRTNPSIFRIGRYLLTQSAQIEVQGSLTGGECEVAAIRNSEEIFISVGSDQCDRELDPLFPDKPKQMCPHPIARTAWPYDEVRDHWDSLRVYHEVSAGGQVIVMQDSDLSVLVNLDYLLAMDRVASLPDTMFLYCGAVPFLDSVPAKAEHLGLPQETSLGVGDEAIIRLHDPILDRTIEHQYKAIPLGDDLAERRDDWKPQAGTHHPSCTV